VLHEVSPFAGVAALQMLCRRGYRPIEISNVLCRSVEQPTEKEQNGIGVRVTAPEEAKLWSDVSARGWSHEHPELGDFLRDMVAISAARENNLCFLAEHEDRPGAAGVMCIHDGVALFGGSATIPELRRRGLHAALMSKHMSYAFDHGCDLAMIVVQPEAIPSAMPSVMDSGSLTRGRNGSCVPKIPTLLR
jgi:hypothetical protein